MISIGSKIFPFDFDIFSSPESIHPCPYTLFGGSIFAANRNAGQYIAWNLNMSLPIICKSAGQKLLYNSLFSSGYFKELK